MHVGLGPFVMLLAEALFDTQMYRVVPRVVAYYLFRAEARTKMNITYCGSGTYTWVPPRCRYPLPTFPLEQALKMRRVGGKIIPSRKATSSLSDGKWVVLHTPFAPLLTLLHIHTTLKEGTV